jgi:hypothetical protein
VKRGFDNGTRVGTGVGGGSEMEDHRGPDCVHVIVHRSERPRDIALG